MNDANRTGILLFLYTRGELTVDEENELLEWRLLSPENELVFKEIGDQEFVRRLMKDFYKEREDVFDGLKTRFPYLENSKAYDIDDFEADPLAAKADEDMRMNFPEKNIIDSGLSRAEFWNTLLEESGFALEVEELGKDLEDKNKMPGKKVKKKRRPIVSVIRIVAGLAAAAVICFGLSVLWYVIFGERSGSPRFQAAFQPTGDVKKFTHDLNRGFKTARAHIVFGRTERGEPMDIFEGNPKAAAGQIYAMVTYTGNEEILQLPDGTRLWMYPNSVIFFPAHFTSDTIYLKLEGKAYFERTSKKHLAIAVNGQSLPRDIRGSAPAPLNAGVNEILVEPSSATFDISAYPNDTVVSMNMVNGSARVSIPKKPADQSIQLESGKQLAISGGLPVLLPVSDTSQILALKYGMINMKEASIQEVLSTVAQWYDVRVEYPGAIPDKKFSLKVPLEADLSVIIEMIKKQGVHITMQGKVITVMK